MIDYGLIFTKYFNDILTISADHGKQMIFKFDNMYGASLISCGFSGNNSLVVIKFDEQIFDSCRCSWDITYETGVTSSEIQNIKTTKELIKILEEIKFLKEDV